MPIGKPKYETYKLTIVKWQFFLANCFTNMADVPKQQPENNAKPIPNEVKNSLEYKNEEFSKINYLRFKVYYIILGF